MNYLITYEEQNKQGYPKSIIIHDIPQWLKDNPNAYIIVCQALMTMTISKSDLKKVLNLNARS
jgi:hypothetical protein